MYSLKLTLFSALSIFTLMNDFTVAECEYADDLVGPLSIVKQGSNDIHRYRRSPQVTFEGKTQDGVTSLRGDGQANLLNTDRSSLDGTAYYQRNFGSAPKYQAGAGLKFNHDSGAFGSLNYDKMPGSSNLGATGGYKMWESRDGRSSVDAEARFNRNFSPYGARNEYGAFITGRFRF